MSVPVDIGIKGGRKGWRNKKAHKRKVAFARKMAKKDMDMTRPMTPDWAANPDLLPKKPPGQKG